MSAAVRRGAIRCASDLADRIEQRELHPFHTGTPAANDGTKDAHARHHDAPLIGERDGRRGATEGGDGRAGAKRRNPFVL